MKKVGLYIFLLFFVALIVWSDFFFQKGTYFLLDSIWFPVEWVQFFEQLSSRFFQVSWYRFLHDFFSVVLGYQLFSKIYFIGVLFLSWFLGVLFAKLGLAFFKGGEDHQKSVFLPFLWGLILLMNPVLYERMFTQPGVYFAMVMLGYGLYFLLKTLKDAKWKNFIFSGLFFSCSVMISAHFLFMVALIYLLYALFFLRSKSVFLKIFVSWILVLLGNANWLIGGFLGKWSVVVDTVATLNQANVESFLTNALAPLNVELTSALLYGFWWEWAGHFYLPTSFWFAWILGGVGVLFLSIYGYLFLWQKNKKLTLFSVCLFLFGWIFATGISSQRFGWINQAMFDHVPMYLGLREPQKWIVLPLLAIAFWFILGCGRLYNLMSDLFLLRQKSYQQIWFFLFVFLLLFLWTPHLLFGFHWQLQLSDYPQDFADYRSSLVSYFRKSPSAKKVLILPWHSYLACEWTHGRVVSNPLKWYLGNDPRLITSDNIEVASLYTNSVSPQSEAIEQFLEKKDVGFLKKFAINKILFMEKCADFQNYDFLSHLSGLNKAYSGSSLSEYDILD